MMMARFNEGKACDAVIRHIEKREGRRRGALCFPEQDHHRAPVEATCEISDLLYAFEHTGIEPFEDHIKLQATAQAHYGPIIEKLRGRLPKTAHFNLTVPATATLSLNGRQRRNMQCLIAEWIENKAEILQHASAGCQSEHAKPPSVPFKISLARVLTGAPGELSIYHLVYGDLEQQRSERVRQAYRKKIDKLAVWQGKGARSVLILEENDIQLTNQHLVARAVREIELTVQHRPDEVYLLSTVIDEFWSLWTLRVDDHVYEELSEWGGDAQTPRIDPAELINITGR